MKCKTILILLSFFLITSIFCNAQVEKNNSTHVFKIINSYIENIKNLAEQPDKDEYFDILAEETFHKNALVYDDFLGGNVMTEYMLYLNKVVGFQGQLQLEFETKSYNIINIDGQEIAMVFLDKKIVSSLGNFSVSNVLLVDIEEEMIIGIYKIIPTNTLLSTIVKSIKSSNLTFDIINFFEEQNSYNITEEVYNFEMVFVKGGIIKDIEKKSNESENDTINIELDNFYIGKTEVTQILWRKVMGENYPNLRFKNCDECPVESVSWNDSMLFIRKLNSLTNENYRLPTSEEWLYAAKGGMISKGYKYAGSDDINAIAWYFKNSNESTHVVGSKQANELGIFDMTGNVEEWCSSGNHPTVRNISGGSWNDFPSQMDLSKNKYLKPSFSNGKLGFRLAKDMN